jgi:hypothetical protein
VLIEGLAHTHTRNKANHSVLDVAGQGFESTLGVLRSEEETRARERLRDEVRKTIFELEPRMRTIVAFHNECLEHTPGRCVPPPSIQNPFRKQKKSSSETSSTDAPQSQLPKFSTTPAQFFPETSSKLPLHPPPQSPPS